MIGILKTRRLSDEQFIMFIVKEAKAEFRESIELEWPKTIQAIGIPYNKREWNRLMENMDLFQKTAREFNLKVEIMHEYKRYLRYSYIYHEPLHNRK